jgi:hypothetical protein
VVVAVGFILVVELVELLEMAEAGQAQEVGQVLTELRIWVVALAVV